MPGSLERLPVLSRVSSARWFGTAIAIAGWMMVFCSAAHPVRAWSVALVNVPEAGPVLAGDRVYWAARPQSAGGAMLLSSAGQDGPVRADARFPSQDRGVPGYDAVTLALAASARRVAVDVRHVFVPRYGKQPEEPTLSQTYAAAPGEALRPLAPQCSRDQGTSVAVSDDVVAYRGPGCQMVVRDLGALASAPLVLDGDTQLPQVAGRYAAVLQRDRPDLVAGYALTVYDRMTQRRVYRIAAAGLPGAIAGLSLDTDGTVVVSYVLQSGAEEPSPMGLARASVQDPVLRPLQEVSGHYAARLRGGKLVVVRQLDSSAGTVSKGMLQLLDPATGSVRTLAAPVDDQLSSARFDFDGQRVTWVSRGCHGVRINVAALDAVPGPTALPRSCPLVLDRRPRVLKRRVELRFSCTGLTAACRGDRTTIATLRTRRRRPVILARSTFGSHQSGGWTNAALTHDGRSLLARTRRLRVRISTNLGDEVHEIFTGVQPAPRRSVIVTLRR